MLTSIILLIGIVLSTLLMDIVCMFLNDIEAFNSTSRYLGDLLNVDNPYIEHMVGQIYPTNLQLNNSSDTEKK